MGGSALAAIGRKVFKSKMRPKEDTPTGRENRKRKEEKRAEKARRKGGLCWKAGRGPGRDGSGTAGLILPGWPCLVW